MSTIESLQSLANDIALGFDALLERLDEQKKVEAGLKEQLSQRVCTLCPSSSPLLLGCYNFSSRTEQFHCFERSLLCLTGKLMIYDKFYEPCDSCTDSPLDQFELFRKSVRWFLITVAGRDCQTNILQSTSKDFAESRRRPRSFESKECDRKAESRHGTIHSSKVSLPTQISTG